MSKGGRYLNNPQKTVKEPGRKASGKKIALIIVAVILALVVILGVGAVAVFKSIIGKRTKVQTVRPTLPPVTAPVDDTKPTDTPKATETAPTEETKPDYGKTGKVVNVLVVGQAAREGEEAKISDSIMLATINKETSTVTVTSFLRDTYIQLASPYVDTTGRTRTCGHNKINMAYALGYSWGGAADAMMFLDQTLTNNFGIEIDYNIEVNFEAFEKAVDLMNQIKLDLDADEAAYITKYFQELGFGKDRVYVEGTNNMDGWATLVYARMRHSSASDNDFKRAERQRTVISQLLKKCAKKTIPELTSIAKELMPYLTTDMSDSEIATLMLEMIPLLANLNFESNQIPAEGTYWSKMYVESDIEMYGLDFDVAKNKAIMQAIAEVDHQ